MPVRGVGSLYPVTNRLVRVIHPPGNEPLDDVINRCGEVMFGLGV